MVTGHRGSEVVAAAQNPESGMLWTQEIATPGFITTNISSLCFVITVDSVDPWDWDTSILGICYKPLQLKWPLTIRWCGFISTENDRHYPALICLYTLWLQWKANGQVVDERDCHTSTLLWLHRKLFSWIALTILRCSPHFQLCCPYMLLLQINSKM